MTELKRKNSEFLMNILNGLAVGTVVVLAPGVLLGELFKLLLPYFPSIQAVLNALALSNTLMGLAIGVMVASNFKFAPIHTISVGLAVMFGGGAVQFTANAMTLSGSGDIINMGITAALAVMLVRFLENKTKAYTILVIPTVSLVVAGGIGNAVLPYVKLITVYLGKGIASLLTLQPLVMCVLLAIIFSILIVSPITTVGIAMAISLSGVGAGAATLGICATGFGIAIAGWQVNTRGTSIAHFIGSPKISMANIVKKPIALLPMVCSAAVMGVLAAIFNIQGTSASAGFGFSGLVGPINALNLSLGGWNMMNIGLMFFIFVVAPVVLNIGFNYLFVNVFKLTQPKDYQLNI